MGTTERARRVDGDIGKDGRPYYWASYFHEALVQIGEAVGAPWRPDDEVRETVRKVVSESLADYETSAYVADRNADRADLGLPPMEVM